MEIQDDKSLLADGAQTPADLFTTRVERVQKRICNALSELTEGSKTEIAVCRGSSTDEAPDAVRMARAYVTLNLAIGAMQDSFKELNSMFRKLGELDFPETLEKSKMQNVPLTDKGFTVGTSVRTKASIVGGQKEEAFSFLRADVKLVGMLNGVIGEASPQDILDISEHCEFACRWDEASQVKKLIASGDPLTEDLAQAMVQNVLATTKNLEALVVDHVFPQTLSSAAKAMGEEGLELPDQLFTTFLQPTTTMRKNSAASKKAK